jgi:hypothetical protein
MATGPVNKKALEKAGFYDKNQTSSKRKSIINKVTTKPQRVALVEKVFLAKKAGSNTKLATFKDGGKSSVNAAGNYTKPDLRKRIVSQVKSAAVQGTGAGQWSARKAQLVAKKYKDAGGGYRD